ncbi:tumor protein p53-inducible nuclear protein 2-like [Polyodon spathula]|uniref:tumor protein p53-inducible nuclear protein 2-like n=1 Tax=Polyodon spathula TaxID=7913 RepID=UPI001B7EB092|nr:tumor protein p53-inducible nuclear protein 2-like [Polyodon spathula]
MIGKIASLLLGDKLEEANECDDHEELFETEAGEWVIVNVQESCPVVQLEMGSLENLLIEHPSMSVYNMRGQSSDQEEEEDADAPRPAQMACYAPRRMTVLEHISHLYYMQRAELLVDRRKLSRNRLHRQNRSKKRYSPKEKHYGNFKQPCQRVYNY